MVAASKVPMLKPGEYEIWRMRIEKYIQMIDYAMWEVIENGATSPKTQVVKGVTIEMPIITAEEKDQRRLEVKARSTLMMGIPNEHQLEFNSIKDTKKLLDAVEKRFGGNATTKKTQRNLLKQQYENFTASSSEMLDQSFDRLQKLVSQLEILEEKLSQEYVNQKLLRSLSPEWNTHVVVRRNKAGLDIISMDDLYNNLKKTGRKLTVNGNETIGFDKSNVECYNCHKRGNFAKECKALRNQDNKNMESSRRKVTTKHQETQADEEIQALYIKEKEKVANFVPVGSDKDERLIQRKNEKAADVHKEKVLKEPNSTKVLKMEGRKKEGKQTHADDKSNDKGHHQSSQLSSCWRFVPNSSSSFFC
nr:ribonuclease H-like domain-containing protein [Tanacetum cinerariifolium]